MADEKETPPTLKEKYEHLAESKIAELEKDGLTVVKGEDLLMEDIIFHTNQFFRVVRLAENEEGQANVFSRNAQGSGGRLELYAKRKYTLVTPEYAHDKISGRADNIERQQESFNYSDPASNFGSIPKENLAETQNLLQHAKSLAAEKAEQAKSAVADDAKAAAIKEGEKPTGEKSTTEKAGTSNKSALSAKLGK